MARKLGVKDKGTRSARRSSYETYKSWVKRYGGIEMSKNQFEQAYQMKKLELKSEGKSTTNLARSLAQSSSFTYDYNTGRAIKAAYRKKFEKNISLSYARKIMQYDRKDNVLREEIDADFWNYVANEYSNYLKEGKDSYAARAIISETIFGSI